MLIVLKISCSVAKSCLTLCHPVDCSTPRLPSPSPSPGVCSDSCPLSWWCYLTTSAAPFFFCLQSSPASRSFPMSWRFASGGRSMLQQWSFQWIFRVDFLRIDWFDLLAVQGTLKSLLQHISKASLALNLLYDPTLTSVHDYWKNYNFDYADLCWKSDIFAF